MENPPKPARPLDQSEELESRTAELTCLNKVVAETVQKADGVEVAIQQTQSPSGIPGGNTAVPKGQHISKDGKWETNDNWPLGLLRYLPNGMFYARIKRQGKPVRRKLDTTDFREACDRLPFQTREWKKEIDDNKAKKDKPQPTRWKEAQQIFVKDCQDKAVRKEYMWLTAEHHDCTARKIVFFWPSLEDRPVSGVSRKEVLDFCTEAAGGTERFKPAPYSKGFGKHKGDFKRGKVCASQYNIMKWVGSKITAAAIALDVERGLPSFANPWLTILDMAIDATPPDLPSNEEFAQILDDIYSSPRSGRQKGGVPITRDHVYLNWACTKFLAMFGLRIGEVLGGTSRHHPDDGQHPGLLWSDLHEDADPPFIVIHNEKKRKSRPDWRKTRLVPFVAVGAIEFIKELRARLYKGDATSLVFEGVSRDNGVNWFLETSCAHLGFKRIKADKTVVALRITQQDLRHYFITACIEAGATFLAISRWVGHSTTKYIDRVYGHLRPEYSFAMTSRVHILPPPAAQPAPTPMITIAGKTYTVAEIELKIAAVDAAMNQSIVSPGNTSPKEVKISDSASSPSLYPNPQTVPAALTPPKQVAIDGVALSQQQVDQLFQKFLESLAAENPREPTA